MQINPKSVKKHFEKSLDKYDENAIVQKFIAEKLVQETALIRKDFDNILELGSGTGLLTKEVTKSLKFTSYTVNDLSEKSKKYIDRILKNYTFISGDAQKINPKKNYDLIISNAVFQWFSNLDEVLNKYKNMLNKGGILAFTTFLPDNFSELKEITGLSLMYKSKNEIEEILNKNYEIIKLKELKQTLEFNSPLELLYHMKNTGVNSLNSKPWTFADVKEFCQKYSKIYHKTTLTYSSILLIARKLN